MEVRCCKNSRQLVSAGFKYVTRRFLKFTIVKDLRLLALEIVIVVPLTTMGVCEGTSLFSPIKAIRENIELIHHLSHLVSHCWKQWLASTATVSECPSKMQEDTGIGDQRGGF